ncbi:T9SS type A sorting domain-containing protein [Terrimonas pollutisoli]|uniref:T9SS type A sorting domain-containing protein n=1 Tax=Terrimonas pollutisoli TaxID=3034147 RepID=UPI0023EDC921|nr:T9SS type A sorting domain-containing protein [Terrimonas sp. H1YJ31]
MYSKIVVVNIPQSKNSISVYPNPVQDHFTIKLPASITQATVILYNNNGAALITQKINTTKQFDVRHLPDGVYYISVQYADKKYQHTLIKH